MINIVYFSKYRESLGISKEQYSLNEAVDLNVLRESVRTRHGDNAANMLADVRCVLAVNQVVVTANTTLKDGDEVAFFPPVTGG
jgi:molybdopterin synthase sulfur carrier subunit